MRKRESVSTKPTESLRDRLRTLLREAYALGEIHSGDAADRVLALLASEADAAEQRERELVGALEATTAELDEVAQLVRVGALASTVVRTATNAANRGKALIEAHRKAEK